VWYVSHVEKNMGRHGMRAVKIPAFDVPSPIAAVSHKLASVQLSESIPWSKSSPRPLDVPVLRACLPSTLSIVEYIQSPKAKLNAAPRITSTYAEFTKPFRRTLKTLSDMLARIATRRNYPRITFIKMTIYMIWRGEQQNLRWRTTSRPIYSLTLQDGTH